MEFPLGNNGGKYKPKGKTLTTYIFDRMSENDKKTGRPIRAVIADKAIEILLDPDTNTKDFIYLLRETMDRESGKPFQTNLNADITASPFEGIPTEKLEALKAKLAGVQGTNP